MSDISMALNNLKYLILGSMRVAEYLVKNSKYVQPDQLNQLLTVEHYFANLPEDKQYKLGLRLDEFILDCKFNGYHCSESGHFVLYKHYVHLNCYTFRYNTTVEGKEARIRSGPEHGLSLILVANRAINPFYYPESNIANAVGFKVVVHPRGTIPPVVEEGIDIEPGKSTNIGLVSEKYHRLNEPYGKCFEDSGNETIFEQSSFVYSDLLCKQRDLAASVLEECGCVSVKYQTEGLSTSYKDNCFYYDVHEENLTHFGSNLARAFCEMSLADALAEKGHLQCTWPCDGQVGSDHPIFVHNVHVNWDFLIA